MQDYEKMARTCFAPIIEQYNLKFTVYDNDEFLMVGKGFALYTFIDRSDRRGDTWYISLSHDGIIREHTLMYIIKERFTQNDRNAVGKVNAIDTSDEYIEAAFKIQCIGFLNHCSDILSGDTRWLRDYPDKGNYSRHIASYLAPFFKE